LFAPPRISGFVRKACPLASAGNALKRDAAFHMAAIPASTINQSTQDTAIRRKRETEFPI